MQTGKMRKKFIRGCLYIKILMNVNFNNKKKYDINLIYSSMNGVLMKNALIKCK